MKPTEPEPFAADEREGWRLYELLDGAVVHLVVTDGFFEASPQEVDVALPPKLGRIIRDALKGAQL